MPINFDNPGLPGRIVAQTYARQALQCALDQDSIIRDIFHGYAYPTNGPVPLVPDSEFVSPRQRTGPMAFDLQRVRQLLQDNGWDTSTTPAVCVRGGAGPGCAGEGIAAGDLFSFTIRYVEGDVALRRMLQQFQLDAAKAGIELRLEEVYGSVMVGQDHGAKDPNKPKRWELHSWNGGWAYYGQPTGEMVFKTGAASNFGHYSDPKADELIERTVRSDDIEALYEYQDYLAEQVPLVFTPGFPVRLLEVANNLRGVEPVNPYGLINPENWYYVEDSAS